ncbi:MAG TPA: 16S rRNA (cytidine(1402)-2'-O)-methyltransferase [Firmicutes bacterium]|jgi:16S rRNA (cytidine1402-2'-O)-methyltransferase|nr:16S rRNA (cytidine(1402)-2'-O)-methyltransferase [Bacillota bacterium]HAZ22863.1 16S rRNA (cytidine(1402)-2'-O)-methyltransferase [Bacillota bacterium]HBE06980.1 16S rRNA (cytidine(1402)-2'-O)-methyltransferase [Bacillota bacterium]HBL48860.1 16S rRNA (cytidine(1402)-2'-O)-methyltransferase [Bacillota bacterium]HBR25246.1 16S rRNA (cytidine(1402)-2'-O)-methyltransferase [Bacillota bacterium]
MGTLFLCATPIGNLQDVSLRLLATLKEVDLIAAEDTRHTRKLLTHFDIHKPLVSYHRHSTSEKGDQILGQLSAGKNIALVSDAGMPGISDPGTELVAAAVAAGITVVPVPGPVAAIAALTASGMDTTRFCFEGFLPRYRRQRRAALERLKAEERTMVFYEAPHRVSETVQDLLDILGNRRIVFAREITKIHEEFWRGTIAEALVHLKEQGERGEYTLVLEGLEAFRMRDASGGQDLSEASRAAGSVSVSGTATSASASAARSSAAGSAVFEAEAATPPLSVGQRVADLMAQGFSEKEALKQLASSDGVRKSDLYRALMRERGACNN